MSVGIPIRFSYKELQIIKHALQIQISSKKSKLIDVNIKTREKLEKDIKEENELLIGITNLVDDLKKRWIIKSKS